MSGKEQVRTRRGSSETKVTWSDCKKSSKSKVAVGTIAREEEVEARNSSEMGREGDDDAISRQRG